MSNEERLERIKKTTTHIYDSNTGECDGVDLPENDFDWLIEQAEIKLQQDSIVEALVGEESLHQQGLLEPEIMRLQTENKKLREALEHISNSDVWFEHEGIDNEEAWLRCTQISDKALEQSK